MVIGLIVSNYYLIVLRHFFEKLKGNSVERTLLLFYQKHSDG